MIDVDSRLKGLEGQLGGCHNDSSMPQADVLSIFNYVLGVCIAFYVCRYICCLLFIKSWLSCVVTLAEQSHCSSIKVESKCSYFSGNLHRRNSRVISKPYEFGTCQNNLN